MISYSLHYEEGSYPFLELKIYRYFEERNFSKKFFDRLRDHNIISYNKIGKIVNKVLQSENIYIEIVNKDKFLSIYVTIKDNKDIELLSKKDKIEICIYSIESYIKSKIKSLFKIKNIINLLLEEDMFKI